MTATTRKFIIRLCLIIGLVEVGITGLAQPLSNLGLNPQKWITELSKTGHIGDFEYRTFDSILTSVDSARVFQFLDLLAEQGKSSGDYFQVRFNCLKARVIYIQNTYYVRYQDRKAVDQDLIKKQIVDLYSSALDIAYRLEDEDLVALVSSFYSSVIIMFGEVGLSVMYAKNGIDLYEKLGYQVLPGTYQFLAELLYKVKEYNECISYGKKAIVAWQQFPQEIKRFTVSCINTVALGFHRQKLYDSAIFYYNKALLLAKQTNDTIWTGIVSGNIGQIYYEQRHYDAAFALLMLDYNASKKAGFFDNAANSLQWAARTDLARGNKTAALASVREAFQLLKTWPDAGFLRNTFYTASQVFREMHVYDSAFYYNDLYSKINDSLEKLVATSSLAITKAKLNDETSRYNIQSLNRAKRSQLLLRNSLIVGIIILSSFILLAVNRKRLKTKLKMEKAEKEKLIMEQEMVYARDQLKLFTENIIEKTNLIGKLEMQIRDKHSSAEQDLILSELTRQTILTEEDWLKFKSLFEKIYPNFFPALREKFNDVTIAEQRMAALTRLHLTVSQMAAILGISPDSVRKTRLRLKQRLSLSSEDSLDQVIDQI